MERLPNEARNAAAPDRIVVSPRNGVFIPLEPPLGSRPGTPIRSGQVVGHVQCGDERVGVMSPFTGVVRGPIAWPGERVRVYQPLLWLTESGGRP